MTVAENVLHPTPQFARDGWIDLRGPWGFAYDDRGVGIEEGWMARMDVFTQTIIVPFPPESPASGIDDPSFHPIVWYRRSFHVAPEHIGKRLILHFGAVDYRADVWVNSNLVARHEGGQTPFQVDITNVLTESGEQSIVVRAEDQPGDLAQPRGKQDWQEQPHDIWYCRTTGIWQPVWLECVGATHITSLHWYPNLDRGTLGFSVEIMNPDPNPVHVRMQLRLHDALIVDDIFLMNGTELRRDIALDLGSLTMTRDRVLWSPGSPNLIDASISLIIADEVVDEVQSYAGLRSVAASGGRFLLNGRPYYLRMALEQGYWPESHLAAPSDKALRREVEIAKELGFNGVRIHQKVEDPRYLYWCDKLGLMVWGEMANSYVFSRPGTERFTREWLEVVRRDSSHPCIVAWVPLNESWGVPNLLQDPAQRHFVEAIYHLTKVLDSTRPVLGNDGWEYLIGDIFGIHDYTFDGETIRERYGSLQAITRVLREVQPQYRFVKLGQEPPQDVPFVLTEFGGISFLPRPGATWFGYGTVSDIEGFEEKYRELIQAVLDCSPLAGFCYTQLTDTAQETNGLVTEHRQFKIDPAIIREINREPSVAVPGDIVGHLRKRTGTTFGGSAAGSDFEAELHSGTGEAVEENAGNLEQARRTG